MYLMWYFWCAPGMKCAEYQIIKNTCNIRFNHDLSRFFGKGHKVRHKGHIGDFLKIISTLELIDNCQLSIVNFFAFPGSSSQNH